MSTPPLPLRVHPRSRETAIWDLVGVPADVPVDVSADQGETWTRATRVGDTLEVLVAGPDATGNPAGTVVLLRGTARMLATYVDGDEHPVIPAGTIEVTE